MNSIPIIFRERQVARTVVGGKRNLNPERLNISVILLNKRGGHLQIQTYEKLLACQFSSIVSVEPDNENYNIEEISKRFPQIKFVIPLEHATDGELINCCMDEVDSEYVLVLRDNMRIPSGLILQNLAQRLISSKVFCIVPSMIDQEGQSVLINYIPSAERGRFVIKSDEAIQDGLETLLPFDFVGLYNKERFIQLGGFDWTIKSSFWQYADLSLRAWLWGEKIQITTLFQIQYKEDVEIPDMTADLSYLRFYLKNILPKFKADHGVMPVYLFLVFLRNCSCGIFEAWKQFSQAAKWVKVNKFRFCQDVQDLIENWGAKNVKKQ